jgi:hypothetical protein
MSTTSGMYVEFCDGHHVRHNHSHGVEAHPMSIINRWLILLTALALATPGGLTVPDILWEIIFIFMEVIERVL